MAVALRPALIRTNLFKIKGFNTTKAAFIPIRNCGWIRDWRPGPYPKTKEEREAAAKKYNLIPEDYEPFPEGTGTGDYPKLPVVGQDARDPYEDLDYHFRRRNFGETLPHEYEIYTSDRHNPNEELRYTPFQMVMSFLGVASIFVLASFLDSYYNLRNSWPLKPKQYPSPGVTHYTFEPLH